MTNFLEYKKNMILIREERNSMNTINGIKNMALYQKMRRTYYSIKNWSETKEYLNAKRQVRRFKNKHKNQACVIVGNGPSLKAEDLTKLYELKIPTFACNRINLIFPQTDWRPTYYFMSDAKLVAQYSAEIDDVPENHRFFPKRYKNQIQKGTFYNEADFDFEKEGKFSLDAAEGIYPAGSVTTEMIQFAYYMGFSEIYLIGVDFSYAVTKKIDSKTYAYQGENNYFVKGYLKEGEVADMPNVRANLLGFHAAREAIGAQGRIIKNATRGGKLEVFERISLDKLFEKWEIRQ